MSATPDEGLAALSFAQACNIAVEVAGMALVLDTPLLDRLIADAEKALDIGVIDPLLYAASAPELRQQIEFLRVYRAFRDGIQPFVLQEQAP